MRNIQPYTPIIALDLDGCQRDFTAGVNNLYIKEFPEMDHHITPVAETWNWFEHYPFPDDELLNNQAVAHNWMFRTDRINQALEFAPIYPCVKDAYSLIRELVRDYDVKFIIVTHQDTLEKKNATLKWLITHNLLKDINEIVFVNNWADKWNYCDIMIDDSPEVLQSKPLLQNKVSIKIDHIYNKNTKADYSAEDFLQAIQTVKFKILKQ